MIRMGAGILSLLLLTPAPGLAHAYLVKSAPARRAVLFKSPTRIQLWFNERLEPRFSALSVHDSNAQRVDLEDARIAADNPKQLSIGVNPLSPGVYLIKFRVLSVDGHVAEEQFSFTIRDIR